MLYMITHFFINVHYYSQFIQLCSEFTILVIILFKIYHFLNFGVKFDFSYYNESEKAHMIIVLVI